MKAKISEIFRSIQGEGKYLGLATVFVRFAGCSLGCRWCDTDHQCRQELSLDELQDFIDDVWESGCVVSLTGGEPLEQSEIVKEIASRLKQKNICVHLETNGVDAVALDKVIDSIDVVAMDMKLPSSAGISECWDRHAEFLSVAKRKEVFVKLVIAPETSDDDIVMAAGIVRGIDSGIMMCLQPETKDLPASLERCLALQAEVGKYVDDVRVIPQVHRLIGVR